jgi:hypothetical protein
MFKMGSHHPFGHLKHKLWSLKVKNRPDFLACRWHATYRWKAVDEGYNFTLGFISFRGLHTKLWAPKVARDLTLGITGQNDIWMLVLWPGTKYNIRGKVVASPKSKPWGVLWICACSWLIRAPKCSNYALTNLLFGLRRSMWVNELLVNFPNPIPELQHLWSEWGLKQSCSPRREHFNDMSHTTCMQGNWGDSWLFVVESQIGNLAIICVLSFQMGHANPFRHLRSKNFPMI